MHKLNSRVINGNDKNKQQTLLTTETRIYKKKYFNGTVNADENLKKLKKQARRLFRPGSVLYVIQSPIRLVRQLL